MSLIATSGEVAARRENVRVNYSVKLTDVGISLQRRGAGHASRAELSCVWKRVAQCVRGAAVLRRSRHEQSHQGV